VSTDLTRIGKKARKDRKLVFTSLYHHISDIDNLTYGPATTTCLERRQEGRTEYPKANTESTSKRIFGTYRRG